MNTARTSYNTIRCDSDGVHLDSNQELAVFECLLRLPEVVNQEWIWSDEITVHTFKMRFSILFDIIDAQDPYRQLQSFWDMVHPRRYCESGWLPAEALFPRRSNYQQVDIVKLLTACEMTDFRSEVLWAAEHNHQQTMDFLLLQLPLAECLDIKDVNGATPSDLAVLNNHTDMAEYLFEMQKRSRWIYYAGDPALNHVPPPHWSTIVMDDEIPDDEIPDDEIPDDEIPDDEIPDDEIPDDEIPDDEAFVDFVETHGRTLREAIQQCEALEQQLTMLLRQRSDRGEMDGTTQRPGEMYDAD